MEPHLPLDSVTAHTQLSRHDIWARQMGIILQMGWLRQKAIARSDPLCRRPALRGPSVRAARSEAPAPAEVASPPAAPLLLLLGALVFDDL